MMSEILFRGKTDNGNWVEGFYCPCCFGRFPCSPAIISKEGVDNGWWQPEKVIPETVGQYTGLTDSNGKKIYEGDICRFREWTNGDMCWIGKVYYEHQQFVISGNKNKECEMSFTLAMSRFIPENIEIIGNIHDNPELLERGQ